MGHMVYVHCLQLHEEVTVKSQELDRENRKKAKLEKELKKLEVRVLVCMFT